VIHEVKIWPRWFEALLSGEKNFEVRENDRGYQKGDTIVLHELDGTSNWSGKTGRKIEKQITFVYSGNGMRNRYVVLALSDGGEDGERREAESRAAAGVAAAHGSRGSLN
jgi:hypothetical protein